MKFWLVSPLAALLLAGCGSSPPQQQVFAPLDYAYLPPIVFKVSSLTVVNNYVPSPDEATLVGEDPVPPATALLAMLNHRLVASGAPGVGTVTIQTASINQQNGNLIGAITILVNLASPDGRTTGFIQASVTASQTAPDSDAAQADVQAALYGLTKKLMDNMNVQLQYQIQQHLGAWISWSNSLGGPALSGGAPASPGAIQATPLTPLGANTPVTGATPAADLPASAPLPAGMVNTNPSVPSYLPGAGPAGLTSQTPP